MKEIINLLIEVLFIEIPLPISLFDKPMYYNMFGLIVVFFLVSICGLIISRLYGGEGSDD